MSHSYGSGAEEALQHKGSRPRNGMGAVVFVCWLLTMIVGFWASFARPALALEAIDGTDLALQSEAWFRGARDRITPSAIAVVYVPATACSCRRSDDGEFRNLARRWRCTAMSFAIASSTVGAAVSGDATDTVVQARVDNVPSLPEGVDLLVFGADSQLLFAGPLHAAAACGGSNEWVDGVLRGIQQGHRPAAALTWRERCDCPASAGYEIGT